ncbi:MAG TPA: phosphoglucosamine mutase [Nitrospirales bacterium]|nr:phosphoglucosamine mutase [Nitrospirales bacterium]HIB54864.1 phosphoglucosamine mutase [Nitrospirales bacterium]HIO22122.1 phosphoglucosamine mutase [Nitrospirales bacterium]
MKKLFGTDGIRGLANTEPMTCETVMKIGRAAAFLFKDKLGRHRIVIGKDTRLSGYMLESALTSGICSLGVDVVLVGPMPTPAVAFLTRTLRADAGIIISASHNPFADNGIKFFSRDGMKLPDDMEHKLEHLVVSGEIDAIRPTATEIGKAFRIADPEGRYIEYVKRSIPKGMTFDGLKVVIDTAHGAAYKTSPHVLQELGASVVVMAHEPDGTNINHDVGALYPAQMCNAVVAHGADIGIAHDGDADRVLFASEKGTLIDGDKILGMLALDLLQKGKLNKNTVVLTVMSNLGIIQAMERAGITVIQTPVGDRFVLEQMVKGGYAFGGEPSGHVIFMEHNTTGDGLITALQVLTMLKMSETCLSKLADVVTLYPQVLINVPVRTKSPIDEIPKLTQAIKDVETSFNGAGRVLLRYSGTESILRVMVEGKEQHLVDTAAKELAAVVNQHVGFTQE